MTPTLMARRTSDRSRSRSSSLLVLTSARPGGHIPLKARIIVLIIIGILIINTIAINARWGVIFGGPIVLGSLAVSVGLRLVSTDGDQDPHTREVVKKVGWRFFAFLIM